MVNILLSILIIQNNIIKLQSQVLKCKKKKLKIIIINICIKFITYICINKELVNNHKNILM